MQYNITYRQKDKGWQFIISYKSNTGKWKQKSKQGFVKKGLAQIAAGKMLENLKAEIDSKTNINEEYNKLTFKNFVDMFIDHQKLYKEGATIESYKISLNRFSKLNDINITDITKMDIQDCVDDMIKDNLKYSTLKIYLQKLNLLFNSAITEYNIIYKSPVNNIIMPREKQETKKRALTQSELDDLLSKTKHERYYIISLLAGKCGLRLGEILGITWDNIDLNNLKIYVTQQLKLSKTLENDIGELKSKNSQREVPISESIKKELEKYRLKYTFNESRRLFKYKNPRSMSSNLKRYYKNIGYDISIHELRHTYATLLISNGIDFKTAAKILGHEVEITMKIYSHVTDDMMDNAANKIKKLF